MLKGMFGFIIILGLIMFFVAGQSNEVIVVPRSTSVQYTPTSINLVNGNSTNDLNDMNTLLDGLIYDLSEVTGTPGIRLDVNFTNITSFSGLTTRAYYDGSVSHAVRINLFNYSTSAWDVVHTINDGRDFETHTKSVSSASNYIQNGVVQAQFFQNEAGNNSHDLYIDYFALTLS